MSNILVCDDEKDIVVALKIYLSSDGHTVFEAYNGRQAIDIIHKNNIDLALLDVMMPVTDGITAVAEIRKFSNLPIILLTAKSEDTDKILGLNVGADDYVTKPFGPAELMARIRTCLRRRHFSASGRTYSASGLEIDFDKHMVLLEGNEVHLTQIEYQLLSLLAEQSGRVLTYGYIMNAIWGPYMDNSNQILRVNMANIRRKIEKNPARPQYVFTEIGIGYRMLENENA